MTTIGVRFKDYRMKVDKTLKETSEATGLSVSFLSDVERGITNPSIETCQRMANYYNTTLSHFLQGVEIPLMAGEETGT